MALLHLTGAPLALTQSELTPLQREFLHHAIPEAWGRLHGRGHGAGGRGRKGRPVIDERLRAAVERRRRGRR